MEGKGQKVILAALALLLCAGLSAQNKSEQRDSLVRLIKAKSLELIEKGGANYRKTIDATFFHNNTYFICDTALWNVDSRIINAWGNVRVVQEGTILTSDKMDYMIDDDLIQARGTLVQLEDKDRNTLRTHYLDYNTKDSLAFFSRGAAMKDKDGQIIESIDGSYDAKRGLFEFWNNVNMFTDSIFIRSSRIDYESGPSKATFPEKIDFWKDDNMLSADRGWYERLEETFFFNGHVHAMSREQEAWCDSLFYYRTPNNILMLDKVQVQDTTRNAFALSNRLFYEDSTRCVTLSKEAAVALRTEDKIMDADSVQRTKIDTIYIGADKLVYYTVKKCEIPESVVKESEARLEEIFSDPVTEYRRKAMEAAAEAARKAAEENAESNPMLAGRRQKKAPSSAENAPEGDPSPADKLSAEKGARPAADSTGKAAVDSTGVSPADTTAVPPLDSVQLAQKARLDSIAKARADSIHVADSIAAIPPPDTSRIGFAVGVGNVKVFRTDIQVACDSMRFCELDSVARFYIKPVVWNDGNRQYSADSIGVLVNSAGIDRASLMGNAFIITQETPQLFDQIRATEVMAYFDTTSALRRFDAMGGANAIFFLKEKEEFATVNKVDSKMLSATFKDGELQTIHYFDSPKNDAYPLPQLVESDRKMKGFEWQPELQPRGKEDITDLVVRQSQRKEYEARPKTTFKQTEIYFPGYMKTVYAAIEAAKNKPKAKPAETPVVAGPTGNLPDSLVIAGPTGNLPDSTVIAGLTGNLADSTVIAGPTGNPSDSLAVNDSIQKVVKAPTKKELREKAYQERIAARDARWAKADSIDAAKAALKLQKKEERRKAHEAKVAEKQRLQDEADARKLEKYVERYRKKYARQQARKARREKAKDKTDNSKENIDGKDSGQIPEVRPSGHPEQRELGEPALDQQAAEPAETPVQRVE